MTSLPVPLVVEMAIKRAWLTFSVGYWTTRLRISRNGAASSSRSACGRLVLQLHDLRRVDYRAAAQRDDLVRLVEIERLHPLHHDLDFGLGIGNDRDMHQGFRRNVAPDNIHVADLLHAPDW